MAIQPARVPAEIEPLVQFVEETDPSEIVAATITKLKTGVTIRDLLSGAALAVARSSDLPPGHHGGPIHPLSGLHAVHNIAERLSGEVRLLPVIQNVALSNLHIHHPAMGPYRMLEMEPLDASVLPQRAYTGGYPGRFPNEWQDQERLIEATKQSFLRTRGFAALAEHHLLWLLPRIPREELLDLMLTLAVPKNIHDDHNFLFTTFTWRALDWLGWDYAPVLLRVPVRYIIRPPAPPKVDLEEALLEEYGLLRRALREATGPEEEAAIGALGEAIGEVATYDQVSQLIARAIADGLSIEGAGEGLSIGAATLYLRSQIGNPMDVHLHTGANNRRYIARAHNGVSQRTKLLALMNWQTGPEVRDSEFAISATRDPDPARVAELPHRDQAPLLDAIIDSIRSQPKIDLLQVQNVGKLRAAPEVQETVGLAQQYANLRYDPLALFNRLAEVVCRDNFTEMHAYKHIQATYEEFQNTHGDYRWRHLVSAAKAAAISHGKVVTIYDEIREILPV